MRLFLCLLDRAQEGACIYHHRRYNANLYRLGMKPSWVSFEKAYIMLGGDDFIGETRLVEYGGWLAVGRARLDNREEVAGWLKLPPSEWPDLALFLRAVVAQGAASIPQILGDFSVVLWNPKSHIAMAAVDAMGVRKLYYAEDDELLAFSDRAETLSLSGRYNVRFLAEQVASCDPSPGLTVYQGVNQVPPGTILTLIGDRMTPLRYWSPEMIAQTRVPVLQKDEAVAHLRKLLIDAIRSRLTPDGNTWSQLSGGLDSSSVVSTTQWLVEHELLGSGLAATVSYVDREGTPADERMYSDGVGDRWGVANHAIVEPPLWYDERFPPPHIDQPRQNFIFYPREYRLAEIVCANGGRVLLTGQGPDEYLRGSMYFFADWLVRGRAWPAVREMVRRAALGRVSFWELAYRNAIVPLMPSLLRRTLGPEVTQAPPWVRPAIIRQYGLQERLFELVLSAGALGSKYQNTIVRSVETLGKIIGHLVLDDLLDVRHPFLDRRLVEFGLHLPPELTTQPHEGKWVLREAMKGIVPEPVRTRVGKGSLNERHAWSLSAQRTLLGPLVHNPVLGDLGVVDGRELQSAFDIAPQEGFRKDGLQSSIQQVLAIEAWLQLRVGRWPPEPKLRCS